MIHEEAIKKTDKSLEKLYEPMYARKRDRKPVPPYVINHYRTTSERLYSLLRTGREDQARIFYMNRKAEIDKMFEDIKD